MKNLMMDDVVAQVVKKYMSQDPEDGVNNIVRVPFTEMEQMFAGYNLENVISLLDVVVESCTSYVITLDKGGGEKISLPVFFATGRDVQRYYFEVNKELKKS